jgi:hypothetical protein
MKKKAQPEPSNPAAQFACSPHLRRTGERVPAHIVLVGEPMCRNCFLGRSIFPVEQLGVEQKKRAKQKGEGYFIISRMHG